MSRLLFIGDLHVKAFLLPFIDKVIEAVAPDRVICMGDYMDDWGVSSMANLESTQEIFDWARERGDVTLLFGNHDMAYYSRSGNCAGNDGDIKVEARGHFETNLDLLRVADFCENWLFSHGGLCGLWAQQNLDEPATAQEAAGQINALLERQGGLGQLEAIGRRRGGWQKPGPLWADWRELTEDYYPGFNQISGHSPQDTCIEKVTRTGEHLWCCDTFSTGSKGYPRGDGSMLLLDSETGEVSLIEQPDPQGLDAAYNKYFKGVHL